MSDSPAYLHLKAFERVVFAEILRRFNGYNNGRIAISYEEIGERLKGPNASRPNNGRIARAIAALWSHGLLAEAKPGSWFQRRAREYRITFISSGKAPPFNLPTNDYLRWQPKAKKDGNAASPEPPRSGNAQSPEANRAGHAQSPERSKSGSFVCTDQACPGDAESLLIVKPYPGPERGGRKPTSLPPQMVDGSVAEGRAA